jgi:hypothetical protein
VDSRLFQIEIPKKKKNLMVKVRELREGARRP